MDYFIYPLSGIRKEAAGMPAGLTRRALRELSVNNPAAQRLLRGVTNRSNDVGGFLKRLPQSLQANSIGTPNRSQQLSRGLTDRLKKAAVPATRSQITTPSAGQAMWGAQSDIFNF